MKLRIIAAVAALVMSPLTAAAVTISAVNVTDSNISEGGVTPIFIGFTGSSEITGDASDVGGKLSWGFSAANALIAIETSTINPTDGFLNPTVTWSSGENGTGTIFGTAGLPDVLTAAFEFSHRFSAGETAWLTIAWDDVLENNSDFDIRIETTPVPVPAAAMLLASALAGFGFLSRRRQKA